LSLTSSRDNRNRKSACGVRFFFTFTRDVHVYARDAFEAKRERKKRVNMCTHALAPQKRIFHPKLQLQTEEFLDICRKKKEQR